MNQSLEPDPLVHVYESQEVENTQLAVRAETHLSPLDVDPDKFRAGLDRRRQNHKALIDWVRGALVAGTDFGSVETKRGLSKPSLWKPGAEKICAMLGVTPRFPTIKDYEQAAVSGVAVEQIILRCELVDSYGNVIAEGVGARSVAKEYGDTNKALKMAEKSAHIDATLRLAGLSEVFTQDLEDMQKDGAEDLTGALERSIEKVKAEKEAKLEAVSPAVREMLEKAEANRAKIQAELDQKPVNREKLKAAGFDVDEEPAKTCTKCGKPLIRGGPVTKPGSKYLGRDYMTCPSKQSGHTWRAI